MKNMNYCISSIAYKGFTIRKSNYTYYLYTSTSAFVQRSENLTELFKICDYLAESEITYDTYEDDEDDLIL